MRLTVDGKAIEVAWWGRHSAALPIVMLHEGLGSVSMWRGFPEALADATGRRVMAYSRFGHGRSDRPSTPHGVRFMHDEARLLPAVLAAAGIATAHFVGHSDGGSIALIFAAEHPDQAASLLLEAPHVFVEDLSIASITQRAADYRSTNLRERLARHHRRVDLAFHGWCDVWLDPAFRTWNLEGLLPAIACPVLLIQGEQDDFGTLGQLDAIERQVPGPVERLVLPDCGHSPHRDQRDRVLNAMTAFLRARA